MFRKYFEVFVGEESCRAPSAFPELLPSGGSFRQTPGRIGDTRYSNSQYQKCKRMTSLKKSLSSHITEQSGDATKVVEGREAARDAGLDRKSSTWKQHNFTSLTCFMARLLELVRKWYNTPTFDRCSSLLDNDTGGEHKWWILTPTLDRSSSLLDDK